MHRSILVGVFCACALLLGSSTALAATCEINNDATYTNSADVTVSFSHGVFDTVYRIDDSYISYFDPWNPLPEFSDSVDFYLTGWQGKQTVYMEFAASEDAVVTSDAEDSIVLDTISPFGFVYSNRVRSRHWGCIYYTTRDDISPKTAVTIQIRRDGVTRKTLSSGWQREGLQHFDFWVKLRPATYRLRMTAWDLAGNVYVSYGRLRVTR